MDVKLDSQRSVALISFNMGVTKFTPQTEKDLDWMPGIILHKLKELNCVIMKVEENGSNRPK